MTTYETEIIIEAPPTEVWKHLTDVGQHDEWSNHFWLRGEPIVGGPGRIEFKLFGIPTGAINAIDGTPIVQLDGTPGFVLPGPCGNR